MVYIVPGGFMVSTDKLLIINRMMNTIMVNNTFKYFDMLLPIPVIVRDYL